MMGNEPSGLIDGKAFSQAFTAWKNAPKSVLWSGRVERTPDFPVMYQSQQRAQQWRSVCDRQQRECEKETMSNNEDKTHSTSLDVKKDAIGTTLDTATETTALAKATITTTTPPTSPSSTTTAIESLLLLPQAPEVKNTNMKMAFSETVPPQLNIQTQESVEDGKLTTQDKERIEPIKAAASKNPSLSSPPFNAQEITNKNTNEKEEFSTNQDDSKSTTAAPPATPNLHLPASATINITEITSPHQQAPTENKKQHNIDEPDTKEKPTGPSRTMTRSMKRRSLQPKSENNHHNPIVVKLEQDSSLPVGAARITRARARLKEQQTTSAQINTENEMSKVHEQKGTIDSRTLQSLRRDHLSSQKANNSFESAKLDPEQPLQSQPTSETPIVTSEGGKRRSTTVNADGNKEQNTEADVTIKKEKQEDEKASLSDAQKKAMDQLLQTLPPHPRDAGRSENDILIKEDKKSGSDYRKTPNNATMEYWELVLNLCHFLDVKESIKTILQKLDEKSYRFVQYVEKNRRNEPVDPSEVWVHKIINRDICKVYKEKRNVFEWVIESHSICLANLDPLDNSISRIYRALVYKHCLGGDHVASAKEIIDIVEGFGGTFWEGVGKKRHQVLLEGQDLQKRVEEELKCTRDEYDPTRTPKKKPITKKRQPHVKSTPPKRSSRITERLQNEDDGDAAPKSNRTNRIRQLIRGNARRRSIVKLEDARPGAAVFGWTDDVESISSRITRRRRKPPAINNDNSSPNESITIKKEVAEETCQDSESLNNEPTIPNEQTVSPTTLQPQLQGEPVSAAIEPPTQITSPMDEKNKGTLSISTSDGPTTVSDQAKEDNDDSSGAAGQIFGTDRSKSVGDEKCETDMTLSGAKNKETAPTTEKENANKLPTEKDSLASPCQTEIRDEARASVSAETTQETDAKQSDGSEHEPQQQRRSSRKRSRLDYKAMQNGEGLWQKNGITARRKSTVFAGSAFASHAHAKESPKNVRPKFSSSIVKLEASIAKPRSTRGNKKRQRNNDNVPDILLPSPRNTRRQNKRVGEKIPVVEEVTQDLRNRVILKFPSDVAFPTQQFSARPVPAIESTPKKALEMKEKSDVPKTANKPQLPPTSDEANEAKDDDTFASKRRKLSFAEAMLDEKHETGMSLSDIGPKTAQTSPDKPFALNSEVSYAGNGSGQVWAGSKHTKLSPLKGCRTTPERNALHQISPAFQTSKEAKHVLTSITTAFSPKRMAPKSWMETKPNQLSVAQKRDSFVPIEMFPEEIKQSATMAIDQLPAGNSLAPTGVIPNEIKESTTMEIEKKRQAGFLGMKLFLSINGKKQPLPQFATEYAEHSTPKRKRSISSLQKEQGEEKQLRQQHRDCTPRRTARKMYRPNSYRDSDSDEDPNLCTDSLKDFPSGRYAECGLAKSAIPEQKLSVCLPTQSNGTCFDKFESTDRKPKSNGENRRLNGKFWCARARGGALKRSTGRAKTNLSHNLRISVRPPPRVKRPLPLSQAQKREQQRQQTKDVNTSRTETPRRKSSRKIRVSYNEISDDDCIEGMSDYDTDDNSDDIEEEIAKLDDPPSDYYVEDCAWRLHGNRTLNVENRQSKPLLGDPDPLPPERDVLQAPSLCSSLCEWKMDDKSRVVCLRIGGPGIERLDDSNMEFLHHAMERNDMTVVTEGNLCSLESDLWKGILVYLQHREPNIFDKLHQHGIIGTQSDAPQHHWSKIMDYISPETLSVEKYLPNFHENFFRKFFSYPFLPGEEYCMTGKVNQRSRPNMGPDLHALASVAEDVRFSQAGNGTVDLGYLCLYGKFEVFVLRRLPEVRKDHALSILRPKGKEKVQPHWPSEDAIQECEKYGYCPCVVQLEPGQHVHINKGRLFAIRKTSPKAMSISWKWMYQGYTAEGVNREMIALLESTALNQVHCRESLAIPEFSLLMFMQHNMRRAEQYAKSGWKGPKAQRLFEKLRGLQACWKVFVNSIVGDHQIVPLEPNEEVFMWQGPDTADNPMGSSVDPYGLEGFECKFCFKELATSYMHCNGCEQLLKEDFNICIDCHRQGKYRGCYHHGSKEGKSNGEFKSSVIHTGKKFWTGEGCRCSTGRKAALCIRCGKCCKCECLCHCSFSFRERYETKSALISLTERLERLVGEHPVRYASEVALRIRNAKKIDRPI